MDSFDADVLIYAAEKGNELGDRVRALFRRNAATSPDGLAGVGSMLLVPEVLIKPLRRSDELERRSLTELLARLDLRPIDQRTSDVAVSLGAAYGLRAPDAVHLATAVQVGAERFVTNNRRDFPRSIEVIDIVYPDQLPEA